MGTGGARGIWSLTSSALVALLVATTVVGCAGAPTGSAPAESTASAEAEGTVESATPEVPVGTTVDADTAAAMNADRAGQYRAYPMRDGSNLVIDRTAPLPDAVQSDVNSKGEALAQQYPNNTDINTPVGQDALGRQIGEIANATGKRAIMVVRENGYDYDGNAITNYYPMGGGMGPDGTIRNRVEVEALVAAFLSDKNASEYVVSWTN